MSRIMQQWNGCWCPLDPPALLFMAYTPTSLIVILPLLEFLNSRSRANEPCVALVVKLVAEHGKYSNVLAETPSATMVVNAVSVGVTAVVPVPTTMPLFVDEFAVPPFPV